MEELLTSIEQHWGASIYLGLLIVIVVYNVFSFRFKETNIYNTTNKTEKNEDKRDKGSDSV